MRERRQGRTILTVIAFIAIVGTFAFLGQIFAQDEDGPPPGMEPDMMDPGMMEDDMGMGGPPGMGGGGAGSGGALVWTEQEMPEELTMTYTEYLARTATPRAQIPANFLFDDEDKPKANTENEWAQLQRIYAGRAAATAAGAAAQAGKPGYGLATRIQQQMAVKSAEVADVQYLYEKGLQNFSFEIRYPQFDDSAIRPGASTVPIRVGVIMKVKPGVDQRYPSLVYNKLKKYNFYGTDRQIFRINDYEGGMWNPKEIYLYNGAVTEWNSLWGQNAIRLTLYSAAGDRIVSSTQSAGHNGGILASLLYPNELNYAPMHETIIAPQDKSFTGGNLNLSNKKGWYYDFSFNVPLSELAGLDRAEAVLVGAGGTEGSRGQTKAAAPSSIATNGGSRASTQAGVDRATDTARRGVGMAGYSMTPGFY